MKVAVVLLSCKGVMGLAGIAFANALSVLSETLLLTGKENHLSEISDSVKEYVFELEGQNFKNLIKVKQLKRAIQVIKTLEPDLVVFYSLHLFNLPILLSLKKSMPSVKSIYVFHDPIKRAKYGVSRQSLFEFLSFIHNYFMLRNVDAIQFTYSKALEIFRATRKPKSGVTLFSVPLIPLTALKSQNQKELKPLSKNDKKKEFDLIFFGRIDNYKDFHTFFQALSLIYREKAITVLMIVQGDLKKLPLKNYPELEGRIRIINTFLTEDEFEHLVSKSKSSVFPYFEATASHGPSVSFSNGVPVIASNVGCFEEYINHFGEGICIEPQNPQHLAEAISTMLNKPIDSEAIKKKNRDATTATIQKQIGNILDLFEEKNLKKG
ncbi:MAG TPA: hypothetical protein DF698_07485, partial [Candidatus Atribacteria bacterium]|nr:hypothetical protein [Candidatus Atribacteria bacterium]